MERCLVCGEQKKFSTLQCKMCGMGIESKMHKTMGFVFCSRKCTKAFRAAMEKSSASERDGMLRRDTVI